MPFSLVDPHPGSLAADGRQSCFLEAQPPSVRHAAAELNPWHAVRYCLSDCAFRALLPASAVASMPPAAIRFVVPLSGTIQLCLRSGLVSGPSAAR